MQAMCAIWFRSLANKQITKLRINIHPHTHTYTDFPTDIQIQNEAMNHKLQLATAKLGVGCCSVEKYKLIWFVFLPWPPDGICGTLTFTTFCCSQSINAANTINFVFYFFGILGGEHPDSRYWPENCCSRFSLTNQTRFLAFWMSLEATISPPPLPNATIIQAVVATSSWIRPVATLQFGSLQCSGAISNVNEKESA